MLEQRPDGPRGEKEPHDDPVGVVPTRMTDGSGCSLAMRRAVVNAVNFLEDDRGMDRATTDAYLSAAANFSQPDGRRAVDIVLPPIS